MPAPGSYELTFTATGYQPTTLVDTISGGQQRLEPTVELSVGSGQIVSGTYLPTDDSLAQLFPAPAPGQPGHDQTDLDKQQDLKNAHCGEEGDAHSPV